MRQRDKFDTEHIMNLKGILTYRLSKHGTNGEFSLSF